MITTPWKIWIDTGGTFTDCVATAPTSEIIRLKVLSSGLMRVPLISLDRKELRVRLPLVVGRDVLGGYTIRIGSKLRRVVSNDEDGWILLDRAISGKREQFIYADLFTREEVPVLAARIITQTPLGSAFPLVDMKIGSTRGTNALLEKKGARTALLVTKGFRDLLQIGTQQRPELFSLIIRKAPVLYDRVIALEERILSSGNVQKPLTEEEIDGVVGQLRRDRIESVAVAFLNSYVNAAHEIMVGRKLNAAGFQYVSLSHALSRQIKILPRMQTTLVNAYLDPIIRQYLSRIRNQLRTDSVKVMSSAGGLLNLASFQPKDSLLSGPAGGVVGALEKAKLSGTGKVITFDMGGTSTDVARCDGKLDYRFECEVGGQRILSPALAIETIASGGGSICHFDGYQLAVGPQSAGAEPGPACYGMGGPLTITDVNLLLGRISPDHFAIPVQVSAADRAATALLRRVNGRGGRMTMSALLLSLVDIANEKMAGAIRKISVQKGHDPSAYSLLSFGGAGGQHACALASLLNIKHIILPYDAGLLSAVGIGAARDERVKEKLLLQPLNTVMPRLETLFTKLAEEAIQALRHEVSGEVEIERIAFLRLAGQETALEIQVANLDKLVAQFKRKYRQVYGHYLGHRVIEIESIRVLVREALRPQERISSPRKRYAPASSGTVLMTTSSTRKKRPVFVWENLQPGARIHGPALVVSKNSTSFVEEGWVFDLDKHQNGLLSPVRKLVRQRRGGNAANLALFTNRFTSLVEDMGTLLQRSSFSVNVKERLDFSCALLDAQGRLIVNAPHIPVHLGSLGVCVREVARMLPLAPGDVAITNHPAFGGSHLPDITLIKPAHYNGALIGYVVNRAHHAEIGGRKPGSMPADATSLEEEGVIIPPAYLVRRGVPQWRSIEALIKSARYPSRSPDENLADLNGALAALVQGAAALEQLCREHSSKQIERYMRAVRNHASSLMQSKILKLKRRYVATESLDDGSQLRVRIRRSDPLLIIDFSGTSPIHPGNLNATVAIVNSVVLYVLRLLVGEDLPLNEGLLRDVRLIIPKGMLRPNFSLPIEHHRGKPVRTTKDPAVVGGNTEISQRLTDTLLKAFGLAACSQGTMNNVLFGNERFGYYETICGGAGAVAGSDGADAVHTHMTNTRITDPEILELRYPVMLEEFSIRKNSGGKGKWRGGHGVIRTFVFNDTLEVNILSQHRKIAPYGMLGGGSGKTGAQYLVREGNVIAISGVAGFTAQPGDKFTIKTPGGGGWERKTAKV